MDRWLRWIPGSVWVAGRQRRRATRELPPLRALAPPRDTAGSAPPAQAVLRVVCAWCGAGMAFRPIAPAQHGLVSHGLCLDCAKRLASASIGKGGSGTRAPPAR